MLNIPPGLALDIDDTLCHTLIHLLDQLQKNFGSPENLTAAELVNKYSHTSKIPYWNEPEHHTWKLALLETDELYENLDIIENANYIIQKIEAVIPISCYITARPEGTTAVSKRWLKKYNFPEREVISKPNSVAYEDGNKWKAQLLTQYHPQLLGIVDDNPGIISALPENYKGTVFLYSHLEYTGPTPINVIPCKDWDTVYNKIISLRPQSQP